MGDQEDKAAIRGIRTESGVPISIREGLSETVESLSNSHAQSIKHFLDLAVSLRDRAAASPSATTKATFAESVKANIDALASDIISGMEEAKNSGVDMEQFATPLSKITVGQHAPEEIKQLLIQWKAASAAVAAANNDAASHSWISFFTADSGRRNQGLKSEASVKQRLSEAIEQSVGAALSPLSTPSADSSNTTTRIR